MTADSADIAVPYPPLFEPASIKPPAQPLRLARFLAETVRNPIGAWAMPLYEQPAVFDTIFGRRFAYLCDPEDIRKVLVSDVENFPKAPINQRILEPALGDGIFTADGAAWKWQRRAVAPVFRANDLAVYIPAMVRATEDTIEGWRASGPGAVHDVDEAMSATTLAIILDTMVSGAAGFEADMVRHNIERYLSPTGWIVAYDLAGLPGWVPHPGRRGLRRASENLRRRVAQIVAARRGDHGRVPTEDLLDRLIATRDPESGRMMSDENLVDTILTFLLAGHETSAVALTWTLALLSQSPQWQEMLRAEAAAVAGSGPIGMEQLDRLVLTEQVLKETMRLFPPASILARLSRTECELAGRKIPADTHVAVPIYAVHRHRRLWENPDAFDPSRFTPEREAGRSRFQYLPFGAGPRICVGAAFALMEMKVVLATLMRHIRVLPSGDPLPRPVLRVTLRPKPKLRLKVAF